MLVSNVDVQFTKNYHLKWQRLFWAIVFWKKEMEKEILGKWKSFDIVQLYNFMRVLVAVVARVDNFRYFSCFPWDFVHILMFVSKLLTRLFENGYTKERWKLKEFWIEKYRFSFAYMSKSENENSFFWVFPLGETYCCARWQKKYEGVVRIQ